MSGGADGVVLHIGNVQPNQKILAAQLAMTASQLVEFLLEKNAQYGDSVYNPVSVFTKLSPLERINVRIDDKISRIQRGNGEGDEDAELDLLGYLLMKRSMLMFQQVDPPENVVPIRPPPEEPSEE